MALDQKNLKTVAAGTAPTAAAKPDLKPLKNGDAALLEFSNNSWRVVVPAGVSAESLSMHPTFWNALAHERDGIREGDDIKVFAEDRAWLAKFEVIDAATGRAIVRLAYVLEGAPRLLAAGPKPFPEGYKIQRVAPRAHMAADGYVVIRERDGLEILDSGMPWKSYQDCYEAFLKNAMFQSDQPPRYT